MKQISLSFGENFNAGEKAKRDIYDILKDQGIDEVCCKCSVSDKTTKKIVNETKKIIFLKKLIRSKDSYILQYPFSNLLYVKKYVSKLVHSTKVAIFIHDIDGLRFLDEKRLEMERNIFSAAACIVAHNEKMKSYLIKNMNVDEKKIIVLEIFDYLISDDESKYIQERILSDKPYEVCYAGNLSKEKSTFLYEIKDHQMDYNLKLYGVGLSAELNESMKYIGTFKSDDLPKNLKGQFGLIWDGSWNSDDENIGFKNYTRYNNPHKLSLYVVSELPVIVWSKSAIADFVKKYKIGFVVDSVDDINNINISEEEYNTMYSNIKELKSRLVSGYYTLKALGAVKKHVN